MSKKYLKNVSRQTGVTILYLPPTLGMTFKNNKVLCYKDFIKTFKDFFESVLTILMEF